MARIKIPKTRRSPRIDSENNDNISDISTNTNETAISHALNENNAVIYFKKYGIIVFRSIKFIIKISGMYLAWIILHFGASHLYIKFCVPSTLTGFIISPFMTASPHCQGLRWIIYNGANTINNMWVILGTWFCSYLIQLRSNNDEAS